VKTKLTFLALVSHLDSVWVGRGGNYIYRQFIESLLRTGHKVYIHPVLSDFSLVKDPNQIPIFWGLLIPKMEKINVPLIGRELVLDILPSVDVIFWTADPTFVPHNDFILREAKNRKKTLSYLVLDYWESAFRGLDPLGHLLCPQSLEGWENYLIHLADYIFCVSPQLCSRISVRTDKEVYWLPNASIPFPLGRMEKKRQIALVVSSVFPCRGVNRIFSLASSFPDWTFLWVGSYTGTVSPLYNYPFKRFFFPPNVWFLGERDNLYLTSLSEGVSVGIVMADRYHFSYYADPTKWYVYHNLGLPVVSFYTPQHERFPDFYPHTFTGTDVVSTFRKAIENLPENVRPLPIHTWEHRVKVFLSVLSGDGTGYGYALRGIFHPTYHNT